MLSELINLNLFTFLLVFCRIGMAFSLLPGIGSQQVPIKARLGFALAVTLIVTPMLKDFLPAEPREVSLLALLLISEVLIGAFIGLIPRVLMAALHTTGTILAMMASMANMFVRDAVAEQQSSVLSSYLGMIAVTLIFVTNSHHLMLAAVYDSYTLFQPAAGPMIGDMSDYLAHRVADSFRIGVQLAMPLIISGVSYYLLLGIMGRLMPALPVFFFGMPIQILMQVYLVMVTVSAMMMVFMRYFEDGLYSFTQSQSQLFGL